MKSHRIRILSAALALSVVPFMGGALTTPAYAAEPAAQLAPTESIYGLASRLPKDTESFASLYRLRELLDRLLASNLVKKILANEELAREFDLNDIKNALENDPQVKEYANLAADLLGGELTIALPAGFSDKFSKLFKALPMVQAGFFMARATATRADGTAESQGMPKEMLPIMEALSGLEVPPVILSLKAGKHKDHVQALIGQVLGQIPGDVKEKLEEGKFETGGASFESVTIRVGKMLDASDKADMERDLSKAYADETKGTALATKLQNKSVEIAWGWLDDYLIISIGQDHTHVKFVTAADSVLNHPDLALHAAKYAGKKPFAFSYTSQQSLRAFHELGGIFDMLIAYAGVAKAAKAPVPLDNLVKELQALDAKTDALWPNDADAAVGAMWWDGGIHADAIGGPKSRSVDSSKPLTLPSLANDKTFIMLAGRASTPFRDKVWSLIEDTGIALYNVYQKDVKNMLPDQVRVGAAGGEAVALPLVKDLWKSLQSFRAAMGDEAAFLMNLDGAMPNIPGANIPSEVTANGRIPRIAWVSELKDRSKLAESWGTLKPLIFMGANFIAAQAGMSIKTDPVEKKEGSVELFGYDLPMDLGDVWPHTGLTATHWYLSTSPSFTKELAAKTPSAAGPALGMKAKVNFPVFWNFAANWAKLLPFSPREKEILDFAIPLFHCIGSLEVQSGEEGGKAHCALHWTFKDAE